MRQHGRPEDEVRIAHFTIFQVVGKHFLGDLQISGVFNLEEDVILHILWYDDLC